MTNPEQTLRERLADRMRTTRDDILDDGDGDVARFADDALSVYREWLESEAALTIAADAIDEHDAWEISMKDRGVVVGTDLLPSAVLKALTNSLGDTP